MKEKEILTLTARIRALAQNGLFYSSNEYDTDRFRELQSLSDQITAALTGYKPEDISACFGIESDYVTPKVDIRAVVFNTEGQILMVQESADGCWSLPGGWADVGFTPKEIAVKEVKEETGLDVEPVRVIAILDKSRHNHPPALHYVYKIFILCHIKAGTFTEVFDILDKGFFSQDNLPSLSEERVLKNQIDLMFEFYNNPEKAAICD